MQTNKIEGVHLPTLLKQRAENCQDAPKRIRTRRKLLAATAAVMEQSGYEGLTIDSVVKEAKVARGTFYLYFADRSIAAIAVTRAFAAVMRKLRPRGGSKLPAAESIYRTNLFYILSFSVNSRLLAGRESLMRDCPQLIRRRDAVNIRWTQTVLRDLCNRSGAPPELLADSQARLAIRAVISMADEFLREIYVYRSPSLVKLAHSPEQVAEALTQVWHRAVFGCDPPGWSPKNGLPLAENTSRPPIQKPSVASL